MAPDGTYFQDTTALQATGRQQKAQIAVLLFVVGLCAVTMLVYSLPPWTALVGVVAVSGLALVVAYPFWSLFFLLCLFFFPMNFGEFTVAQACGVLTLIFGFSGQIYRRRSLVAGPFLVPLLWLGGVMFLSFFYAQFSEPVWGNCRRFALNVLLYLVIQILVDSRLRLRQTLDAFLLSGSANAVYGIYTAYTSDQPLERAAGFVGNANQLGFICAFAVPLAFHRFVNGARLFHQLAYLGLCGILLAGVMVSASRGAVVSLLAGLAVCLYQLRHRRRHLLLLLVMLLSLLPLAPDVFYRRVSNLATDVEGSFDIDQSRDLTSRGYLHKSGLRVWRDHPVWGVGVGNFGKYFVSANYNPGWARGREVPQHNVYLRVLVENGLVGFTIFCWILWRFALQYRSLLRASRTPLPPHTRAIIEGFVSSVAVFAVMGLSMDFLYTHELYILLALTYPAGMYWRSESPSHDPRPAAYSS